MVFEIQISLEVLEVKDKLSAIAIKQLWKVTKALRGPLFGKSG